MGAALARLLARQGYVLAIVARRADLLASLAAEVNLAAGERRALDYVHDVRNLQDVPRLLKRIVAELGGLDLVIFSAGITNRPPSDTLDFELDREMLEVNLLGAIAWLDPVANLFRSAGSGHIVGISSVAADRGRFGNPVYNSAKAGLTAYLEGLRNRLARHGVRVLTVKPGFVETEQLKAAPKVVFPISAEAAASQIWAAIRSRKQQVYVPAWWALAMFVVRNVPSFIFRRLSI
jgi:NAD(P)-dependent dehydrogenase (short-subunit alcohol dehydrogenase family)